MTDKDKALQALQLASHTCSAALIALSSLTPPEANSSAPLSTLLSDYSSLLTLIYTAATKVSLALKPTNPTYAAALTPLKDITAQTDALASCACSVDAARHGRTLAKEVRWTTEEVVGAVQALAGVFLDAGARAEGYLVKVGTVHEIVERARGVSASNREAVRRRWEADAAGLEDGVREVAEMVADEEGGSDDAGDGFAGDGWDDLGLGPSLPQTKITKEEIANLKTTHNLLRLTHALHKRVLASWLGRPSSLPRDPPPPHDLDDALARSNALLSASDELVSALYTPQDPQSVSAELTAFRSRVQGMQEVLSSVGLTTRSGSSLEERAAALSLEGNADDSTERDRVAKERRWFDVCFEQIYKAYSTAIDTVAKGGATERQHAS